MYLRSICLLLTVWCAYSQESNIPQTVTPDTVVATINGRKFTLKDYEQLLANMTPQMREAATKQPQALLEQYAMFENILAEAEKSKLDQQSPHKERLAEARRQILVQAQINDKLSAVVVSPEEVKKTFEANRMRYTEAKAKVIFISSVSQEQTLDGKSTSKRGPEESEKLAGEVVAKLKAGGDFAALAKQYSDDGSTAESGADFPDVIRGNSASIPQDIRDAILSAKAGDLLGPLTHTTGFYIFRVESINAKSFDEAKDQIYNDLKQEGLKQWLDEAKSRSTVKIENQGLLQK